MRDAVEENDKEENRIGLYSEKYPFCTFNLRTLPLFI